jgi:membrane fusion protein (multidrug efflux system)
MSKLRVFIIAIVALIAAIIVYNKVLHPQYSAGDRSVQKNKPLQVGGYVVRPRTIENSILSSGTLIAAESVDLHAQVSGTITRLNVNEGAHVAKATLLVKLFDDDLQAQLKKLEAQKESAERTEERLKQLLSINGVGQQDYDNALTQLKSVVADIDNCRAQIEKTEIHAPFDGVVGLKNVSIGAYITPAITVASLQQTNPLKLDFSIPEKYAAEVRTGDSVQFSVAGVERSFAARVLAMEPRIDEDTRTVKVRAVVDNAQARLFAGAFAKIVLALHSIDNALMVPTQCVIPDTRGSKVVVVSDGKADFRTVQTGIRSDSLVQVTSGVNAGDTIVATALLSVKQGMGLNVTVSGSERPERRAGAAPDSAGHRATRQ